MILHGFDKVAFEIMQRTRPDTTANIVRALSSGLTAQALERRLRWKYGSKSTLANLVICTAYHLERLKKLGEAQEQIRRGDNVE